MRFKECDWEEADWAGAVEIGELTRLQYTILKKELEAHTGQCVVRLQFYRQLSKRDELSLDVLLGKYDFLTGEQKKALATARRIVNQVRTADGCEDKNVEEPIVTSSICTNEISGTQKKRTKSRSQQSPPAPTKGNVHLALLALLQDDKNAKYKTAEQVAEMVKKKYKIKRCSVSAVKATLAWKRDYVSPRRRVNAIPVEDAHKWVDHNARDLNSLKDKCQDLDGQR